MEVMSCEELMDKKISCSVQSSALFHMVNCIVKTTINVIQSEISSIRIYTSFSRTVPYLDILINNILELPGGEN